jgi:hypothetical protein
MVKLGTALRTGSAAARSGLPAGALTRLRGVEPPESPAARDEFFARLLPDLDAAWHAAVVDHRGEFASAWLLDLRKGAEHAAERCLYPDRGPRRCVRFCAVALHVEVDAAVPESQVDCALAWAAEAVRGGMSPIDAKGLTCAPAFFRYHDLMAVPLSVVRACLVSAAAEGNPSGALRGLPFLARPAAARCSPIYLRFVVGLVLSEDSGLGAPEDSDWSALADIVRAALAVRLRVPVTVAVARWRGLFAAAHEGLRRYQAARLGRIVSGIEGRSDVSAVLDLHGVVPPRRLRLVLSRGHEVIAACMLQVPWDESPAQMPLRIRDWLLSRGITRVTSLTGQGARAASSGSFLAEPV